MKSTIIFEHGETTCAVTPGVFCRFWGTKNFGTKNVCGLFCDTPLYDHTEGERTGWVARCRECLKEFPA